LSTAAVITPTQGLRVAVIAPSPTNPRKTFDKETLAELTDSVRRHGVLQPVLVRPWSGAKPRGWNGDATPLYELVSGERRLKAAKAAGLEEIPGLVRELHDDEVLEIQLIENLQRNDLHPLEEAAGYRQLMAAKYDAARIAERIGRSVKYVYDRVKLLNLTKAAQQAFTGGEFSAGHAVILARLSPEDQERAMADPRGGLFTAEETRGLFTAEEDAASKEADYDDPGPRKPVSVRELQAWVNQHTKLEADQVEPMLFPASAITLNLAAEQLEKVVRITHDAMTPEEAKDGPRVILGRSWKRADGLQGSKECELSVIGMIVIGPGRGQALRVCINKKRCGVHWGENIKATKKREKEVAKAGGTGEDREALRVKKIKEEQARRVADEARWRKAEPAILDALAAAVKKAPAGAAGVLGGIILKAVDEYLLYGGIRTKAAKHVPMGKSAEDLVRHLAFALVRRDVADHYDQQFSGDSARRLAIAKGLGVDVKKIVDQVAPLTEAPKAKAAKKAKKAA